MEENENGKLLIDSVQLRFGDNVVLQSAFVTSYKGRVTGVLGRNGTGKSCLFKCIMGGICPQNKYINSDAEFCVLDEPFSNIAPVYDEKIRAMIQEQKARKGIIITDHVYEEILRVADDLFLLRDGFTYQIHSRDDLVRLGYILS